MSQKSQNQVTIKKILLVDINSNYGPRQSTVCLPESWLLKMQLWQFSIQIIKSLNKKIIDTGKRLVRLKEAGQRKEIKPAMKNSNLQSEHEK